MTTVPLDRPLATNSFLHKSERVYLAIISALFLFNLWVDYQGPQRVDWLSFAPGIIGAGALITIGGYYRRRYPHVAWLGKAAIIIGLAAYIALMMGVLFHQKMPRPEPVLTDALLAMDHWFGYDWPSFVAMIAQVPFLGTFLRYVYLSSFLQILVLLVTLAYMQRDKWLDIMNYTTGLSLVVVYIVWESFPNLSQSTYLPIPMDVAEQANLVTNSLYGALIKDLAVNGLPVVSVDRILGAVAFPSYQDRKSVV